LHRFFAEHLKAGGTHITANFDRLIEDASLDDRTGRDDPSGQVEVVHFHGMLGRDPLPELGARFERIEGGFSKRTIEELDDALLREQLQAIIVVGYSGRDHYDLTPFLLSRMPRLKGVEFIWMEDSRGAPLNSPLVMGDHTVVRGMTADVLGTLADAWGMALEQRPTAVGSGTPGNPTIRNPPSDLERLRTAANLYGRMGLRTTALETAQAIPEASRTASEWNRLADAHWGRGEFAAWLDNMLKAVGDSDEPDVRVAREELRARFNWITGRLVKAAATADRTYAENLQSVGIAPATWLRLLETQARTLDHMRRLPDTRWLVSRQRVATVSEALERSLGASVGHAPLASLNTARAALADLRGTGGEGHNSIINDFNQSDFLSAWMSYRHGWIRRSSLEADDRHALVERLRRDERTIGALAEIDRTYLLPGEARYLSWAQWWRLFRKVEYTPWHRIRLRAGIALHKLTRS
jgi:hypothetical protein